MFSLFSIFLPLNLLQENFESPYLAALSGFFSKMISNCPHKVPLKSNSNFISNSAPQLKDRDKAVCSSESLSAVRSTGVGSKGGENA